MPEEWSASGARLPLSLEVCFTREPVSGGDLLWSVDEPSCCPAKRLLVTSAPTIVGAEGEVAVAVGSGGWLAEPTGRQEKWTGKLLSRLGALEKWICRL